jgi:hypothetical protein
MQKTKITSKDRKQIEQKDGRQIANQQFNRFSVTSSMALAKESATIARVEAKPKSRIWIDKKLHNIKTEE